MLHSFSRVTGVVAAAMLLNACQTYPAHQSPSHGIAQTTTPPTLRAFTDTQAQLVTAKDYFLNKQYDKAFKALQHLAELGDPDAQYGLGYLYYYGKGTNADPKQGIHWIRASAQQGFPTAKQALKLLHLNETPTQQKNTLHHAALEQKATSPVMRKQSRTARATQADTNKNKSINSVSQRRRYGPTTTTDTLWSIAKSTRPNHTISMHTMMTALLKINPLAFSTPHFAALKKDVMLDIPTLSELQALTEKRQLKATS